MASQGRSGLPHIPVRFADPLVAKPQENDINRLARFGVRWGLAVVGWLARPERSVG